MATVMIFHEVNDGAHWAKAWKKGAGSRHEFFAKYGVTARNFKDPSNPNQTGILAETPDLNGFMAMLETDEGKKAMAEDGLKVDTIRILTEFTP